MAAISAALPGSQENSQSYFNVHLNRYLKTLELLPNASPGQRLLELGAAFHHLTPALVRSKGYSDVRCSDLWEGEAQTERRVASADGEEEFHFPVDNFDIQTSPWPYADGSFDTVLCCEMLEHLVFDPLLVLSEINRILKMGGRLLLTTPNIASAKGVEFILRGGSPYVYGSFEKAGLATDRHNREYTPGEVECILQAAGFDIERLETHNSWWTDRGSALRHLAAAGFSIALRGDDIFCLARKAEGVRNRYPAEFYLFDGTQVERRASDGEPAVRPESDLVEPPPMPLNILVVHEALPRPDCNGCDVRLMQVLNELLEQGHQLTYVARNGTGAERYAAPLEQLGIKVYNQDVERFRRYGLDATPDWTFEAVLKEGRFDLAILFHWFWSAISVSEDYLDEIRRYSPETRVAVLSDDQHGLRERRLAKLSGRWMNIERARDFEQREFEVYRQADMVLAISEADREGMLATAPELKIEILPMVAEGASSGRDFSHRSDILFLGNFENAANLEGLTWLLKEVWPCLAASLPQVQLHLAGHRLPKCPAGDGIISLGYVEDLDAAFAQHRLFIAPVRHCTGIQTKILAALARGLPVVTTPAAAEGLGLRHEKDALVAATAGEFAEQTKRAYRDEGLWRKLSLGGLDLVQGRLSRERLAAQVRRIARRVSDLTPKAYDTSHAWSVLRIEKEFTDLLTAPVPLRTLSRIHAYCTLAEYLLAEGDPAAALEQLRHVFTVLRGPSLHGDFFARILLNLDRCYRELGSPEVTAKFVKEAQECLGPQIASPPSLTKPIGARPAGPDNQQRLAASSENRGFGDGPPLLSEEGEESDSAPMTAAALSESSPWLKKAEAEVADASALPPKKEAKIHRACPNISVVIPTHNRCATLASCLANLERQSLAKDRFEVIVVNDGSTDGTERLCQGLSMSFPVTYLRQTNAGAGAARRLGCEAATGKYLLLFNDDTVAPVHLLAEHLRVQRSHSQEKCAVLGHFRYPGGARKRALPSFFATRPFLFPQLTMKEGVYGGSSYFIACNLSIRRQAVLGVGSFDPQFRVAEDTELGVRLEKEGYRILYHPKALAWHDHVIFTSADLIKRARAYALADLLLFRKHPHLLGGGEGPFGRLDGVWMAKTKDFLDQSRRQIAEWTQALGRLDKLDFAPLVSVQKSGMSEADSVLKAFDQIVPQVHWFHLFERLLELMDHEKSGRVDAATLSPCGATNDLTHEATVATEKTRLAVVNWLQAGIRPRTEGVQFPLSGESPA